MPTQAFWNDRWMKSETGWDLGEVSPPIKAYLDQRDVKDLSVLIPGCGNAYEAAYLLERGCLSVTLIDIAPHAVEHLRQQFNPAQDPRIRILLGDFFAHEGQYDLIIEQTFFCAIDPSQRDEYVRHMARLLKPGATLAGVLFNRDFEGGPPFGGNIVEYRHRFAPYFHLEVLEPCRNSIAPRAGAEAFFRFVRKE